MDVDTIQPYAIGLFYVIGTFLVIRNTLQLSKLALLWLNFKVADAVVLPHKTNLNADRSYHYQFYDAKGFLRFGKVTLLRSSHYFQHSIRVCSEGEIIHIRFFDRFPSINCPAGEIRAQTLGRFSYLSSGFMALIIAFAYTRR